MMEVWSGGGASQAEGRDSRERDRGSRRSGQKRGNSDVKRQNESGNT